MVNLADVTVRQGERGDVPELLAIYDHYVDHTAVTFDVARTTPDAFREAMVRTMGRYPFLVAEGGGVLLGYGSLHPFVGRDAYDWNAETTIYLAPDARGQGLGTLLYETLGRCARAMGILCLEACIATTDRVDDPHLNDGSVRFHRALGFHQVAHFRHCGFKFGRWYDMVWMERRLAPAPCHPSPIRAFPEVAPEVNL